MQQRYYDPMIGRFLSRDPVTVDPNSGVNFNAYWYANNNPYKFTDPDGRQSARIESGATEEQRRAAMEERARRQSDGRLGSGSTGGGNTNAHMSARSRGEKPSTSFGVAYGKDALASLSNVGEWKQAATDAGNAAYEELGAGLDLFAKPLVCTAKCSFNELIGENIPDAVVKAHLEVGGRAVEKGLSDGGYIGQLKAFKFLQAASGWKDAAEILVCTNTCAHQED